MIEIIVVLLVGCLAGFINVVAGGGSLLTLPILISFVGLDPTIANGTNRVAIFAQNVSASQGFKSKGVSAWPFSLYIGIAAFMGAIIGALIAVEIPDNLFNKVLAVVMVIVVLATIFNPSLRDTGKTIERLEGKYKWIAYGIFFLIGIYGGFIQAGTGLLIMSALTIVNRFDLVKANSAKVVVALIYTISALAIFIYSGQVNWLFGLALGAGTATGGWVASRWSVNKGNKWIKWFMIVAVTMLAINLWQPELKTQAIAWFVELLR